ncbi:MAG: NAD+ synthase [Bdellovibrio sp.]|nr:NAD+ synthase [Bdellovibrio sp.]
MSLKIAISQLDPVVGAFEQNVKKIKEAYKRACAKEADLLLTPELSICGYPPHDLMDRPEIFDRNEKALEDLQAITLGKSCALVVGHVAHNPLEQGRAAQNVVTVLESGKKIFRQAKMLLPTYDVFDEARYFEPAKQSSIWEWRGEKIALAICEDLWAHDPSFGRRLYGYDPIDQYREAQVTLAISLSASPYEWGKRERREKIHQEVVHVLNAPLIYVNQVGATDEILFDGGSFALNHAQECVGRLPLFRTSFGILEVSKTKLKWLNPSVEGREDVLPSELEILFRALVTGIREYFLRTGFKTAVIGLSGGIDSSVVAVLAAQALGAKNVIGVAMPSQYSSSHSIEDAEILAKNLGLQFYVKPIKFLFSQIQRELSDGLSGGLIPIALENIQSRLRGLILMGIANNFQALVLTTGNKSELATGYCTLYGDMVGAIAPIGDIFKTKVYELAQHMNQVLGDPIPQRCLTRPPSAELRPNQTDQDTLPPYKPLDELLEGYIETMAQVSELEKELDASPIVKRRGWVREVLKLIEVNEFKRRQAAPVLKVSHKAFGIGRRIPIAKIWDQ